MDLFDQRSDADSVPDRDAPLAARMRPRALDDIVGQDHILGPGRLLRRAVEADRLSSLILYGPPGSGKTSLAAVIGELTRSHMSQTSGVLANVAGLRALIEAAVQRRRIDDRRTILFIDEIHRFNKAQQDVLLPHVEAGVVTLIGATTHNPSFFINTPLTSRSLVFELRPLSEPDVVVILERALTAVRGFAALRVDVHDGALAHLARACEGDARRALNALEIAVRSTKPGPDGGIALTREIIEDSIQRKAVLYDHDEDGHYDTISAFIKSVRGADPHAAVYWLAKMLYAGEDPRFIARRLVILASEDIGNADPRGLLVADAAAHAVDFVGMPEARIILSQATTYLATAPKSNASCLAIDKAMSDVERNRVLPVPERLKNVKIRAVGKEVDAEEDTYRYPHDYAGHHVQQEYVPTTERYYEPDGMGYEEIISRRMRSLQGKAEEHA